MKSSHHYHYTIIIITIILPYVLKSYFWREKLQTPVLMGKLRNYILVEKLQNCVFGGKITKLHFLVEKLRNYSFGRITTELYSKNHLMLCQFIICLRFIHLVINIGYVQLSNINIKNNSLQKKVLVLIKKDKKNIL